MLFGASFHTIDRCCLEGVDLYFPRRLWLVCESAGSFFEEPKNLFFIVVPGTEMYVPETEEFFFM